MSQLVKAVMANDTGDRKLIDGFSPLFRDVFDRKERVSETVSADFYAAKVYEIGVHLGARVTVSELDAMKNPDDVLSEAIKRTKRSIVEACFGEFREDFYRLQDAIYNRDFQKARSLLTDFQQRMFEDI